MEFDNFQSKTTSHIELLSALETISVKFLFIDAYFTLNIIKDHIKARCEDVSGKNLNCEERKTENIMKCED